MQLELQIVDLPWHMLFCASLLLLLRLSLLIVCEFFARILPGTDIFFFFMYIHIYQILFKQIFYFRHHSYNIYTYIQK